MLIVVCLFVVLRISSRGSTDFDFWAAVGAVFGVILFINGFRMLRYKRIILNTPFSKIRSAAMGLVEVSGMAKGPQTIPAGLTGDPCYFYHVIVSKLEQDGKNKQWKRVVDESLGVPFFVDDSTGSLLVEPMGADLDIHKNFSDEISSSFLGMKDIVPPNISKFLLTRGLSGQEGLRLEEYCIKPDYPLFVMGTLGRTSGPVRRLWTPQSHVPAAAFLQAANATDLPGNTMSRFLNMVPGATIASSPGVTIVRAASPVPSNPPAAAPAKASAPPSSSWASVSLDDGLFANSRVNMKIKAIAQHPATVAPVAPVAPASAITRHDPASASSAVAIAEPIVASDDNSPALPRDASGFDLNPEVSIGKGPANAPFAISSRSQKEVVQSLAWKSALYIWGGPALTLACLYFLADAFGWL